jgi:hypothetical protein
LNAKTIGIGIGGFAQMSRIRRRIIARNYVLMDNRSVEIEPPYIHVKAGKINLRGIRLNVEGDDVAVAKYFAKTESKEYETHGYRHQCPYERLVGLIGELAFETLAEQETVKNGLPPCKYTGRVYGFDYRKTEFSIGKAKIDTHTAGHERVKIDCICGKGKLKRDFDYLVGVKVLRLESKVKVYHKGKYVWLETSPELEGGYKVLSEPPRPSEQGIVSGQVIICGYAERAEIKSPEWRDYQTHYSRRLDKLRDIDQLWQSLKERQQANDSLPLKRLTANKRSERE